MAKRIMLAALISVHLSGVAQEKHQSNTYTMTNKEKAVALLKVMETGDTQALQYVNPGKYIQHNLMAPDGIGAMEGFLKMAAPGSIRVNVKRVFVDSDYVFTHSEYELFGPKIGFDIFRFENGLIVEHWDNLQETPPQLNPSGHSMVDGSTLVADLDKTEANKNFIRKFFSDIVEQQKGNVFDFIAEDVIQHTPLLPDGLQNALKVAGTHPYYHNMLNHKLKMVLGEGNFVLAGVECTLYGKPAVYYDLFRIENGKIAERWDVMEEILPKEKWQNTNGKF